MARTTDFQDRIAAFARELAAEMGVVDDSDALSWLDAIESEALAISDAVHAELVKEKSGDRPPQAVESACPHCGKAGVFRGDRERELIGRRGPITIREPEHYCSCCRKSFFPSDARHRR